MINFPGCMVLFPGVVKIFQIKKILRFDKSDTNISDLIMEFFSRDKSSQFSTAFITIINFLFCTVLPPGASEVNKTHKLDDFIDLTQFFQICRFFG